MNPSDFFPDRPRRPYRDDVATRFPFPLAWTYERLHHSMDQRQPVEAAWALRDAVECAVKFCACVAVADVLAHDPEPPHASAVVGALLETRGLAIGSWLYLLHLALEPLQALARDDRLADANRSLPQLFTAFYEPRRPRLTQTAVLRTLREDFAGWRNSVFGHGVFQQDRAWYARETLAWLPRLHAFLDVLRPVLDGWRLVAQAADGDVDWQGCDFRPLLRRHQHQAAGAPLPMTLVPPDTLGRAPLSLGPLLAVQRCRHCHEPAAFFFDRQKSPTRTVLLEYFRGHHGEEPDWPAVRPLLALKPVDFDFSRRVYDTAEVVEGVPIQFRDFDQEYLRPAYLLDAVWRHVRERPRGYLLLTGPAGVGKSYLVRGLVEKESQHGQTAPVLGYHIQAGPRADCQLFAIELNEQVRQRLGLMTVDLQLKGGRQREQLQKEFAEFVSALMRKAGLDTLLIAVDGLDELPEAERTEPLITDLLPDPAALPDGCFVLLATRDELRPRVQECLRRLRGAGPEGCCELRLDPTAADNEALVRAYLGRELPAEFRGPGPVGEVLRRSGGVFLYAAHYSRALAANVFADASALPRGEEFYPVFLARLRDQVGPELYEGAYLPLLLYLSAAPVPVTREQLEGWGLPAGPLSAALNDLRDFVRVRRVRTWHESLSEEGECRYALAHEDFVRFVRQDGELRERLRRCHETVAAAARARGAAGWTTLDPTDDADLYALRFALVHAEQAGRAEWVEELVGGDAYARGCWNAGDVLWEQTRFQLGLELYELAVRVSRGLVEERGRSELRPALAAVYMNQGVAQTHLGRLEEALASYAACAEIREQLVRREGRAELRPDLATVYMNQGVAQTHLGRLEEALASYAACAEIREQLVRREGRAELRPNLATVYMNRGVALDSQGRLEEALASYAACAELYEQLVRREGRAELRPDLATVYMNQGNALNQLGRLEEALASYAACAEIREQLVRREGRTELRPDLAWVYAVRAQALVQLAQVEEARRLLDLAIPILREEIQRTGRADLRRVLAFAENTFQQAGG